MAELEQAAARAIEAAQVHGEVLIVTNGNGNWVMESAGRFMPGPLCVCVCAADGRVDVCDAGRYVGRCFGLETDLGPSSANFEPYVGQV